MIRSLLVWAFPVVGLGVAAAVTGPSLMGVPGGEAMVVAAPGAASLQHASYDGDACASTHRVAGVLVSGLNGAGIHLVAIDLKTGKPSPDGAPAGTSRRLVLAFDASGRLLAAEYPAEGGSPADVIFTDCAPTAPSQSGKV
ncbi:MAG: hypothetical protein GC147_01890 [Porphyrobacter sp.]|nr:hypothetical protein [Porphyrobacter sp.]